MPFWVEKTSYGVTVTDVETREVIAVDTEELGELVGQLSQHLEPEIDFNTVVYSGGPETDGAIRHSFSPKCPAGCYGQTDECVYVRKED